MGAWYLSIQACEWYVDAVGVRLLALSTSGIDALRFRRLHQRLTAIAEDDVLLKRESLGKFLNQDQLRDALEERGMYVK